MEQTHALPSSGKVAIDSGLISGLIVGIIDTGYSIYISAANPPFVQSLFNVLPSSFDYTLSDTIVTLIMSIPIYILLFIACVQAGLLAARKTQEVKAGLLAGLWTGIIYVIIDVVVATVIITYLVAVFQIVQGVPGTSWADLADQSSLNFGLSFSIITGLIVIGIGTGLGALGGLLGKNMERPVQLDQSYTTVLLSNPYQGQSPYSQELPRQTPPPTLY